jgi:hypothetical protein
MFYSIATSRSRTAPAVDRAVLTVRMSRWSIALLAAILSTSTFVGGVWAQSDNTLIGGSSFSGANGIRTINQAAGVGNQEANAAVITTGPGHIDIQQFSWGILKNDSKSGDATISGNAFAGSSGITQVTQASGSGNIEANAAFIGIGFPGAAMDAVTLSQMRGGAPLVNPNGYDGHTSIAPTAFAGATGVVQVEQAAGNNNIAGNVLSVHVGP